MNFETAKKANGTVSNEIALATVAVAENYGTEGEVRYYADGVDQEGTEYRVSWETTVAWDEATERANTALMNGEEINDADQSLLDDESNACDWENPIKVELV